MTAPMGADKAVKASTPQTSVQRNAFDRLYHSSVTSGETNTGGEMKRLQRTRQKKEVQNKAERPLVFSPDIAKRASSQNSSQTTRSPGYSSGSARNVSATTPTSTLEYSSASVNHKIPSSFTDARENITTSGSAAAKRESTPTPSGTSGSTSVYDRLYAYRRSPLPLQSSSRKSPNFISPKQKKEEQTAKIKALIAIQQELQIHPLFLKHSPKLSETGSTVTDSTCNNKETKTQYSTPTNSRAKQQIAKRNVNLSKAQDRRRKLDFASTHIQRIYRGFLVQTFIATITVVYAVVIIQSAYRRHNAVQLCRQMRRKKQEEDAHNTISTENNDSSINRVAIDSFFKLIFLNISTNIAKLSFTVSTASKRGGLSNCRSRLYDEGSPFIKINTLDKSP